MFSKIVQFFQRPDKNLVRKVKRSKFNAVSVYGIGDLGKAVVRLLDQNGIVVLNWYDSAITANDAVLLGHPLTPLSKMEQDRASAIVLASELFADEMQVACEQYGFAGVVIRLVD